MTTAYIYDWSTDNSDDEKSIIRIFCLTENNETIILNCEDFLFYIYLELPATMKLYQQNIDKITAHITKKKSAPMMVKQVKRKKLYYANNQQTFKFLQVFYHSHAIAKNVAYMFSYPQAIEGVGHKLSIKPHEHSATPYLQVTCQLNIPMCGWIEFTPSDQKQGTYSRGVAEYSISYSDIKGLSEPPSGTVLPIPCVLSFDIEVYSSNPNVMPRATNESDCIFQMSCVFKGCNVDALYLLSLGTPDPAIVAADYPDAITLAFDSEISMLLGFISLIHEHNPHVIIGYNILGFDMPYIIDRCKLLRIVPSLCRIGMLRDKECIEHTDEWSSGAYGKQKFRYIDADGRIWLDLLVYARREFKLENYKLDTVASEYLNYTKDSFSVKDIFRSYELGVLENGVSTDNESIRRNTELLSFCGKYCLKDSVLVYDLFKILDIWVGITEMASICNVPISYLYTKGEQIKIYSQVYKYCYNNNIVVENDAYKSALADKYQGATVMTPDPGLYNHIVPFDFKSLYPSIIIAYNIDYSTLVRDEPTKDTSIPDHVCNVIKWKEHVFCEHCAVVNTEHKDYVCNDNFCYRFLKPTADTGRGVIPTIIDNLLTQRAKTRSQLKCLSESDALLKSILNKRQLAYKLASNAMYGGMGVTKGYLPFMAGAMCITALGRKNLAVAQRALTDDYKANVIYSDSVSGDTPIILSDTNETVPYDELYIESIELFTWTREWESYPKLKPDEFGLHKEQYVPGKAIYTWTSSGWKKVIRFLRHKTLKKMYRINTGSGCVDVTEDHSLLGEFKEQLKPKDVIIGQRLLHSIPLLSSVSATFSSFKTMSFNDKVDAQRDALYMMSMYGREVNVFYDRETQEYVISGESTTNPYAITQIIELPSTTLDEYVYDIETEDGTFLAGVGSMIVKNTDSCYVNFPHVEPIVLYDHSRSVERDINNRNLFLKPVYLEFEESVYNPFLIFTKKRYMYRNYNEDGSTPSKIGSKGVLLSRRDNSAFVRDLYRDITRLIFDATSLEDISYFITQSFIMCCSSSLDQTKFTITKSVKDESEYKVRPLPTNAKKRKQRLEELHCTEDEYALRSLPAQVQLAHKLRSRGVRVDSGQRIEYLITSQGGLKAKIFDKIEDVDYQKQFAEILRIEYLYYLDKATNPLDQMLSAVFKKIKFVDGIYKNYVKKHKMLQQLKTLFAPKIVMVDRPNPVIVPVSDEDRIAEVLDDREQVGWIDAVNGAIYHL